MFWISIIFFFSGFSALIYQLLWMRHLGFIFGNTVFASATVLTAFMGGLGLGAHFFGRFGERLKNPLKCFAWLEWGVAVYALSIPFLFHLIQIVYGLAYRHISEDLAFLTPLRFILAFLLLLFPTICMGGTLPVLVRGLARNEANFGSRMGWLYGINTLGAVAGIFLSGFYLIPAIGLTNTNFLAVSTELVAGLGAWMLACGRIIEQPSMEPARPKFKWRLMPFTSRYAISITMLCGFVSLALEVVWFRSLILVFGSTTYSFTVMLGVFLLGMSVGSLLIALVLDRIKNLLPLLATTVALIGFCTLWSLYRFDRGPDFLLNYLLAHGFSWQSMNQARFLISVSHLALPAILFGISFTAATRMVRHDESSSSGAVGMVYALNTLGAVAGSFVGGFILLPTLGMERSLVVLSLLMLGGGLLSLILWSRVLWPRLASIALIAVIALVAFLNPPAWNKSMLSAGAFFAPLNFIQNGKNTFRQQVVAGRLLHYKEGLSSTVSVHINDNEQRLFCVDGKAEADQSPRGMVVQRMIGHLPMLFHPDARKVINIGLGAGVSFGALSCHPVDHLEVVEIEPAVKVAAMIWSDLNHAVMHNPKALITINDGRNHLLCTTNTYDVITSDPFEPVVGGSANLFTVNHFTAARNRLQSDGIMCQWIPMYEMSPDDYLTIVRSFVSVFPKTALFYTGGDTLLLGFKGDMKLDAEVLRRNYNVPEVRQSLSEIGFTSPEMILGMFVADLSQRPDFAGSGKLNTDDRPCIEYSAPKSALHYTADENQTALLHVFTAIPDVWLNELDERTATRLKAEHEAVRLTLEASVLRAQGKNGESFELLSKAHEISPDNPVVKNEMVIMLNTSAQTFQNDGRLEDAAKQFQIALQLDPTDFWSLYNLVGLGMRAGNPAFAKQVLDRAMAAYPGSPLMLGLKGKYLFGAGQQDDGIALLQKALEIQPGNLALWKDLQMLSALAGDVNLNAHARKNAERIENFINRK
ncbi:MAG: fused MFS/spermidine synthase [Kiritimatiellales bacterium]